MKKYILLLCTFLILLSGCQPSQNDATPPTKNTAETTQPEETTSQTEIDDTLYKSEMVEIKRLPAETKRNYSQTLWMPLDKETAYTKNTLIVYGEITSVDEAVLTLNWGERPHTENITLFQLRVNEVLYQSRGDVKAGDVLSLGTAFNANNWCSELAEIAPNEEFLIFCYPSSSITPDPIELSKCTDYWVEMRYGLMLERVDDHYITTNFFSDVKGRTKVSSYLGLREDQASAISRAATEADAFRVLPSSAPSDATGIVKALLDRCQPDSGMFWQQVNSNYIVPAHELHAAITATAQEINGG